MPTTPKAKLNIIGAGHVGKTLGRLWHDNDGLDIQQIATTNLDSAQTAAEFIGSGEICLDYNALRPADFWLITTPDSSLEATALQLANLPLNWPGAVVFHCSGALPASLLNRLQQKGAAIASCHPIHSFADPTESLKTLVNCYIGSEGDPEALIKLEPLFNHLGCRWQLIDPSAKRIYHAAAVFACNYLVTLLDAAEQCLAHSVQSQSPQAPVNLELLKPLIEQTLQNVLQSGPKRSLSGPIKRGDFEQVQQQLSELKVTSPKLAELYQQLGLATLDLTSLDDQNLANLQQLLS